MQRIQSDRVGLVIALVWAFVLLSACTPVTREGAVQSAATAPHAETEAHAAPHWGYTGDVGPEFWGDLDSSYALCETGTSQSPIDITNASQSDVADIAFHYAPASLTIVNNGHTVQVDYPDPKDSSYIEVGGNRYDLQQFHFHAPSEHEINGALAEMELHLVHKSAEGKLAVVGVLWQVGAENTALMPVWAHLPTTEGPKTDLEDEVNAAALLPADHTTFQYSGSLTTPPCSEDVSWFVMAQQAELSADQLAAFTAIYDGNRRPVQPLNERELVEDVTQ